VIVIGAMKCATSAVHAYLDVHPEVAMSTLKELNFFNGPAVPPHQDADTWWVSGQWHRGLDWYSSQFDPCARVRGESSPAYTSPSCPEVPARMASVVPGARLVYLVREPVERAVSQYAHHVRDGAEDRSPREALLDPGSQYLSRSRYYERLSPFLEWFDLDQVHIVVQERLFSRREREISAIYRHIGVDERWRDERHGRRHHVGTQRVEVGPGLRAEFEERVRDDVDRLRDLMGDPIAEWAR
jgi:Sulfotransferase family